MAYLREIGRECQTPTCTRGPSGKKAMASVELMNQYNASMGVYCVVCGKALARELQKREDALAQYKKAIMEHD